MHQKQGELIAALEGYCIILSMAETLPKARLAPDPTIQLSDLARVYLLHWPLVSPLRDPQAHAARTNAPQVRGWAAGWSRLEIWRMDVARIRSACPPQLGNAAGCLPLLISAQAVCMRIWHA